MLFGCKVDLNTFKAVKSNFREAHEIRSHVLVFNQIYSQNMFCNEESLPCCIQNSEHQPSNNVNHG